MRASPKGIFQVQGLCVDAYFPEETVIEKRQPQAVSNEPGIVIQLGFDDFI